MTFLCSNWWGVGWSGLCGVGSSRRLRCGADESDVRAFVRLCVCLSHNSQSYSLSLAVWMGHRNQPSLVWVLQKWYRRHTSPITAFFSSSKLTNHVSNQPCRRSQSDATCSYSCQFVGEGQNMGNDCLTGEKKGKWNSERISNLPCTMKA